MMHVPADDGSAESGVGAANVARHWRLRVDTSERHAALLDLARRCGDFEICMEGLAVGDYLIDDGIVIERKTYSDFATSLVDGRLFPQAAALARSPHRPIVLLEGPTPAQMPDVHAHSLKGAMLSLAVMWRLPVICSRNPEDSLRILRLLAGQLARTNPEVLQRYDRKPKRFASRRLYMLQGLPGVGPALANRLLVHFGSVERVITADQGLLAQVRGIGASQSKDGNRGECNRTLADQSFAAAAGVCDARIHGRVLHRRNAAPALIITAGHPGPRRQANRVGPIAKKADAS